MINRKIYVGQTTQNIKRRWQKHCGSNSCCPYLSKSIVKYGKENFTVEEIDGANSLSELNYLETHYIYKFNSLAPNGYNLQTGGRNFKRTEEDRKKISVTMKKKCRGLKERKRLSEISKNAWTDERKKLASDKMKKQKYSLGRKIPIKEQDARAIACGQKPFLVHKISGEFVGEFVNIKRFCRENGLDRANFSRCLKGINKTCKGFIAKYKV